MFRGIFVPVPTEKFWLPNSGFPTTDRVVLKIWYKARSLPVIAMITFFSAGFQSKASGVGFF